MLPELLIATRNQGKAREFEDLFRGRVTIRTLLDLPEAPEIEEDGVTFEANATKKALEIARIFPAYVMADDSGLEVDALGGRPGVFSARYAGEPKDDGRNNEKLLEELSVISDEKRGAQFRCVLVMAQGDRVWVTQEGICRGRILRSPRGSSGFGYDPLFVPEGSDLTFAQMALEQKHQFSHRATALKKLIKELDILRIFK